MVLMHVAILVLGAAAGWPFGYPVAGVAVAATGVAAWHVLNLGRLRAQLAGDQRGLLTISRKAWREVLGQVQRLQGKADKSKKLSRRLAKQWRTITNALPDAGLLLDKNFNITQLNDTARSMLRIVDEADKGRPITRIIRHPDFVEAVENRRFASPVPFTPARAPDRTLLSQITPVSGGQYILIVRDVTEQIRTEKVKTDFVANASHELRTPLTVIKGYLLGLSEDRDLPAAWREPVAEMNLHADRMHSLVADLLALNQFEAEVDAPRIPVDMVATIRRACAVADRLQAETAMIRCECESACHVLGDESALRSVVTNLLTNAVRFTPTDGHITARWWVDDSGGHFCVEDGGIGIDPDEIERVTERFYRTDPGRARHQGGTGLGLAIVKHALAMHGASLQIESEPSTGSRFTCHFPADRIHGAA